MRLIFVVILLLILLLFILKYRQHFTLSLGVTHYCNGTINETDNTKQENDDILARVKETDGITDNTLIKLNSGNKKFKLHEEFELEINIDKTKYTDNSMNVSDNKIFLISTRDPGQVEKKWEDYDNDDIYISFERHAPHNIPHNIFLLQYRNAGNATKRQFQHFSREDHYKEQNRFKLRIKKDHNNDYMISFFSYAHKDDNPEGWSQPSKYTNHIAWKWRNGSIYHGGDYLPVDRAVFDVNKVKDGNNNIQKITNREIDANLYVYNYNITKKLITSIEYTNLNEKNTIEIYNRYENEIKHNNKIIEKLNTQLQNLKDENIISYKRINDGSRLGRANVPSGDGRDNTKNEFFTLHKNFRLTFDYYQIGQEKTKNLLVFTQNENYDINLTKYNGDILSLNEHLNVSVFQETQTGFTELPRNEGANYNMRLPNVATYNFMIEQKLKDGLTDLEDPNSYEFIIKFREKNNYYKTWTKWQYEDKLVLTKTTGLSLYINKSANITNNHISNFTYECLKPPVDCNTIQNCEQGVTYESVEPTKTSDKVCTPVSSDSCSGDKYELQSPTLTKDRICKIKSSKCDNDNEYISAAAGPTKDITCTLKKTCEENQFISEPGGEKEDRTCKQITKCEDNQFISKPHVARISDRECQALTVCNEGKIEFKKPSTDIEGNKITDRVCGLSTITEEEDFEPEKTKIEEFKNNKKYNDQGQFLSDEERKKYTKNIKYSIGGAYLDANNNIKQCSYQEGCYKTEPRHFETQACSINTNRVCEKCKTCELGKEYIKKFCGESGGSSNTECSDCKICGEKEFKVEGCSISNRSRDTICKPKTICKGRTPSNNNNYIEPKDGIYTYEFDPGYSMGAESPYIGKDRVCEICEDCPPGSETIGGCVGENSTVNTKCQKLLNIDKILENQPKCGENNYYNISKARTYLEGENANLIASAQRKPLNENYEEVPLPDITDEILKREGCVTCIDKDINDFYQNENNPGCEGFIGSATSQDRIYIPRTMCKKDGTEMIIKKGGKFSDDVCGPCRCPPGKIGTNPKCDGTEIVENCEENIPCSQIDKKKNIIIGLDSGNSNSKVYTYDKPSAYGDTTRADKCKVCDTKCPPGTFRLQECDPLRSTNLVCKDHTTCDPETQIVLEPGTSTNDTICKCIDGYEWQKDNLDQPHYNKPCVEIKGKCWTNPCHERANCYDNFNENGSFDDFVCKCDITNNWVETEKLGRGSNGCTKISDTHTHDVNERPHLSPEQSNDYKDLLNLKPNSLNVIHHTDGIDGAPSSSGTFHSSLLGAHIHK